MSEPQVVLWPCALVSRCYANGSRYKATMPKRAPSEKEQALDGELRRMWKLLEDGTPEHLLSTVDQLQADASPGNQTVSRKKRARKAG